ncbi:hypothetical protein KBW71_03485 [Hydrogenophaga aromaticivorans]|uniref:hypothetical protein n=1 Tax=Hydrogenophaga aromaticivorans TaxID=2610898 RepID=UPI001B367AE6|nr:hypothetical protein [Hydrogenophaga aromaticivorans]MBQ0917492.1 hypothetical protein [Hydrogenophaga aromaticivorans]
MSKPFDWMSHLGFEVQDAGGVTVINEEGDMREADLCHRVLWDEMVSLKVQRDDLFVALKAMLEEDDGGRAAVQARDAIAKAEQPAIKHMPSDDTEGGAL